MLEGMPNLQHLCLLHILLAWLLPHVVRGASPAEIPAPATNLPSESRRLAITTDELRNRELVHTQYTFDLKRDSMKRSGMGEFWLSFANDTPKMRWRGAAHSPRFGEGEITVVVDPETQVMHTLFKLGELHEAQCVSYSFPDPHTSENKRRLQRMSWRLSQVDQWLKAGGGELGPASKLTIQWSRKLTFHFNMNTDDSSIESVQLKRGSKVVKNVHFQKGDGNGLGTDDKALFGLPAERCPMQSAVRNPMASLKLTGPHEKSSALKDLLLVLADRQQNHGEWPRLFLVLCALTVPGDVAVMVEDPEPPDLSQLHAIAFDYTAEVVTRGVRHISSGSIWADVDNHAFRLRGEAKETKVGPLFMDLIGDSAKSQVYANVNLTVQREQQCVTYDYPLLHSSTTEQLKALSMQKMKFFAISDLRGEDCAIFVAPLARGRWIHVWVDLEEDNSEAILRSEIHKDARVIRSTDVKRWLPSDDVVASVRPKPSWGCSTDPGAGQLAHLGLNRIHKRSIELQDVLFSLKELDGNFAILELLGLTGDVAIMVEEPKLPALWKLPAVSFSYSMSENPDNGLPTSGSRLHGTYAADLRNGHVRMTTENSTFKIAVAFEFNELVVRLKEGGGRAPVCMTMPIDSDGGQQGDLSAQPVSGVGIFDGVETIGDEECNRFTFVSRGFFSESVELWFSAERDTLCRISMKPPGGDARSHSPMILDVRDWQPAAYHPSETFSEVDISGGRMPEGWHCRAANSLDSTTPWLSLAKEAPSGQLPAANLLAKLAGAAGMVGLSVPHASMWLSRLGVVSPSEKIKTSDLPRVNMFGPQLTAFSFSFTSTHPLQHRRFAASAGSMPSGMGGLPRSTSSGEVHVDLVNRQFHMRSTARNVSAGIPIAETRLVFNGARGKLYAYSKLGESFEQCWAISTAEAFPVPPVGAQRNPFMRARPDAHGFSVPGHEGMVAQKHVLYMDATRVQLFVGGDKELVALGVDDLKNDISTGITVNSWTTAQPPASIFEMDDRPCVDQHMPNENQELGTWGLLRIFFPRNFNSEDEVPRRELSV